jgi:glycine/D-amino acid oxidase-like deaminating enzyme
MTTATARISALKSLRPLPSRSCAKNALPGFDNCVSSNGYTLAPVLSRLTAEMLAGRSTSLPVERYSIRRFG